MPTVQCRVQAGDAGRAGRRRIVVSVKLVPRRSAASKRVPAPGPSACPAGAWSAPGRCSAPPTGAAASVMSCQVVSPPTTGPGRADRGRDEGREPGDEAVVVDEAADAAVHRRLRQHRRASPGRAPWRRRCCRGRALVDLEDDLAGVGIGDGPGSPTARPRRGCAGSGGRATIEYDGRAAACTSAAPGRAQSAASVAIVHAVVPSTQRGALSRTAPNRPPSNLRLDAVERVGGRARVPPVRAAAALEQHQAAQLRVAGIGRADAASG